LATRFWEVIVDSHALAELKQMDLGIRHGRIEQSLSRRMQ
jgi:hypothetical protein